MDQESVIDPHRRGISVLELFGIIALVVVFFLLIVLVPLIYNADLFHPRIACQERLKAFSIACRLYAAENSGYYPPIQYRVGSACCNVNTSVFMANGPALYPKYLSDPSLLVCPSNAAHVSAEDWNGSKATPDPCRFDDSSYVYTGFMFNEALFTDSTFYSADKTAAGIVNALQHGRLRESTLTVNGSERHFYLYGSGSYSEPVPISRLRYGIERFMLTDINGPPPPGGWEAWVQSRVVVSFDAFQATASGNVFNHAPDGGNVLYMDGHVEFRRSGVYPYTPAWAKILASRRLAAPAS